MGQAISSMAMGAASFLGSSAQGDAAKMQGAYQQQQYDFEAKSLDMQASDAIRRGDKDAAMLKTGAKKMIGSQRAAFAADGVALDSGSALDVQMDTAGSAEVDALQIRNNAWREANGYKIASNDATFRGKFAAIAGDNSARTSLLTGGMSALGYGVKAGYEGSSYFGGGSKSKSTAYDDFFGKEI